MAAKRTSRTTTISLPPKLFREAFRSYQREEQEWGELVAYGETKAREAGVRTDDDVERIVDEVRRGSRSRRR